MTGDARWLRLVLKGQCSFEDEIRDAVASARSAGHRMEVRVTWERGDAARYASEAAEQGVETIVAGGGDGTVNEIVCALSELERKPTLGILPLGTANDFADSAGIAPEPARALEQILEVEPRGVDYARVSGGRGFLNVATGGFGSRVTADTPDELKRVLGGAAYFVTGLTRLADYEPEEASLRGPDFDWSGSFSVLAIGNGRQAGGGNVLCPEALADDGLLDVRLFPEMRQEDRGEVLREILSQGLSALEARIVEARVPWLEIEAPRALQLNLDGEPLTAKEFRIEVVPRSVALHLPSDSILLSP